ncbi:MAG: hypothetical protein ACP5OU_02695 [Methanothrix sp.]
MAKWLRPTGRKLVGATFICIILIGAAYGTQPANLPDLQSKLKESISSQPILNPDPRATALMLQSPPSRQSISLSSADPSAEVSELVAVNSVRQRDIICDEEQTGDANDMGLVNSLGVKVTGQEVASENAWPEEDIGMDLNAGEDVESVVDNAINASLQQIEDRDEGSVQKTQSDKSMKVGNDLDIAVTGISVTALNTAEGGSAVATSNIVIKPVQIIICSSEIEEKLK